MSFLKFWQQNEQREAEVEGQGPQALTTEEFDRLVGDSAVPVVVDFWAEWCGPCHMLAPSVQQLARDYEGRAVVAKVNADEYPELLERYGIMGIPTLLYFRDGKLADQVVGVNAYGTLKSKLERLMQA